VTLTELHARLGELLPEHGNKEVALNYEHQPGLHRITSADIYETTGPGDWPTFVRLGDEHWNDAGARLNA
jgi:hypothetical protein